MMRCPDCDTEVPAPAASCGACGAVLPVGSDGGDRDDGEAADGDATGDDPGVGGYDGLHELAIARAGSDDTLADPRRLGTFHRAIAPSVTALLVRRGIPHRVEPGDAGTVIEVAAGWRDDLRAELTLTWGDLLRRLDPDDALEVRASGGSAPGWFDAPRGGYIDRAGRLVVGVDAEDAEDDANRVLGPLLLTVGSILAIVGWWAIDSSAIAVTGLGIAVVGLFVPR